MQSRHVKNTNMLVVNDSSWRKCWMCKEEFDFSDVIINCAGPCEKYYHSHCAKLTNHVVHILKSNYNGACWLCLECRQEMRSFTVLKLKHLFELNVRDRQINILKEKLEEFRYKVYSRNVDLSNLKQDNEYYLQQINKYKSKNPLKTWIVPLALGLLATVIYRMYFQQ